MSGTSLSFIPIIQWGNSCVNVPNVLVLTDFFLALIDRMSKIQYPWLDGYSYSEKARGTGPMTPGNPTFTHTLLSLGNDTSSSVKGANQQDSSWKIRGKDSGFYAFPHGGKAFHLFTLYLFYGSEHFIQSAVF
jgi:hypothetical protein